MEITLAQHHSTKMLGLRRVLIGWGADIYVFTYAGRKKNIGQQNYGGSHQQQQPLWICFDGVFDAAAQQRHRDDFLPSSKESEGALSLNTADVKTHTGPFRHFCDVCVVKMFMVRAGGTETDREFHLSSCILLLLSSLSKLHKLIYLSPLLMTFTSSKILITYGKSFLLPTALVLESYKYVQHRMNVSMRRKVPSVYYVISVHLLLQWLVLSSHRKKVLGPTPARV